MPAATDPAAAFVDAEEYLLYHARRGNVEIPQGNQSEE